MTIPPRSFAGGLVLLARPILFSVAAACSAAGPTEPADVARATAPDAESPRQKPQVLVSGLFAAVPPDFELLPRESSFARILEHATVFSMPHVLALNDTRAELHVGSNPPGFARALHSLGFSATPHIGDQELVTLVLDVELDDPQELRLSTTVEVNDGEIAAIPTAVEVNGRRLVLFIQPAIVRTRSDLDRAFARARAR